jgi:hypothetical protein
MFCFIAVLLLNDHFVQFGVDDSHGIRHAKMVLNHMERAIAAKETEFGKTQKLILMFAALLHDADDRKYFGDEVFFYFFIFLFIFLFYLFIFIYFLFF